MEVLNLGGMWERFNHTSYPFFVNRFKQNNQTSNELKNHFHDYAQIFYLLDGKYTHTVGDVSYEGFPGSFIIIPPGYTHIYEIEDGITCDIVMICIMPSFFDKPESKSQLPAFCHLFLRNFSAELGFEPMIHHNYESEDREKIESIITKLASYNWLRSINNYNNLKNIFFEMFSSSLFPTPESSAKKVSFFLKNKYLPLIKTIYHMNINYNKIIHREELISMSNICQTEYFRLIKRAFGCTFSNYMQMIRVRRAVQLCSFTTYSLSYIADICGFGDLAYMEKRIKKFNPRGALPREMKKNRGTHIKNWPFSIKSRSEYENISKHFFAYGL